MIKINSHSITLSVAMVTNDFKIVCMIYDFFSLKKYRKLYSLFVILKLQAGLKLKLFW